MTMTAAEEVIWVGVLVLGIALVLVSAMLSL